MLFSCGLKNTKLSFFVVVLFLFWRRNYGGKTNKSVVPVVQWLGLRIQHAVRI